MEILKKLILPILLILLAKSAFGLDLEGEDITGKLTMVGTASKTGYTLIFSVICMFLGVTALLGAIILFKDKRVKDSIIACVCGLMFFGLQITVVQVIEYMNSASTKTVMDVVQ